MTGPATANGPLLDLGRPEVRELADETLARRRARREQLALWVGGVVAIVIVLALLLVPVYRALRAALFALPLFS